MNVMPFELDADENERLRVATVGVWRYEAEVEEHGDVSKISHFATPMNSQMRPRRMRTEIEFTPYRFIDPVSFRKLADMGWPSAQQIFRWIGNEPMRQRAAPFDEAHIARAYMLWSKER